MRDRSGSPLSAPRRTIRLALGALALVAAILTPALSRCICGTGWGWGPDPRLAQGRELFTRQWSPNDPRSHGGDGLGPAFNERSCFGCHNQGGVGGAGANDKNVDIVTLTSPRSGEAFTRAIAVHPGFRDRKNLLLHKFGVDPRYETFRRAVISPEFRAMALQSQRGRGPSVSIQRTQRSTPALFGAGEIDAITEADILALAESPREGFPEIKGRVARDSDGKAGRFGWKAQTASLGKFVADACANELGLEMPGRRQGSIPTDPERTSPGLDLSDAELDAMRIFVASLPRPSQSRPTPASSKGRILFESIGCAACHVPDVGRAKGLYSDLLLHEMAPEASDAGGGYGTFSPESGPPESADPARRPASPREWRTPPLWGVARSAPYLHDGRAPTLEKAILLHGGEASATLQRYNRLNPRSRRAVIAFLESLGTPTPRTVPGLRPADLMAGMAGRTGR